MMKQLMCMIREGNLLYDKKLNRSIDDMHMLTSRDFYTSSIWGTFGPQSQFKFNSNSLFPPIQKICQHTHIIHKTIIEKGEHGKKCNSRLSRVHKEILTICK